MSEVLERSEGASALLFRFGLFELDTARPELRRRGRVVNLSQQSFTILIRLIQSAGKIVSREELQRALWPAGTFVEFEVALYTAVNRLRRDLNDSATQPRFIETVPKQGYRFIAPVESISQAEPIPSVTADANVPGSESVAMAPANSTHSHAMPLEAAASEGIPLSNVQRGDYRLYSFFTSALALFLLGAVLVLFIQSQKSGTGSDARVFRYSIVLPPGTDMGGITISPRGDQLVYDAAVLGVRSLYRRYLDEDYSRRIPGTDDGHAPFFSPDGKNIGFYTPGHLKVVNASGVRIVASLTPTFDRWNGVWAGDGFIYFNGQMQGKSGVWRVREEAGTPELMIPAALTGRGSTYAFPNEVIGAYHPQMIYTVNRGPLRRSLQVMDIGTRGFTDLLKDAVGAEVLSTGQILYYSNGSLFVAPFDAKHLKFKGSAVEVVKDVAPSGWMSAKARVSKDGTLVYVRNQPPPERTVEFVSASGEITQILLPRGAYEQAVPSPDGLKLALVRRDGQNRWTVWSYQMRTGAWIQLLEVSVPRPRVTWSPDSRSIITGSERSNADFVNLVRIPLDAPQSIERLTQEPDFGQFPEAWSAAANAVLFLEGVHPDTKGDVMVIPLGGDHQPHPLITSPGWDRSASFSPDGGFVLYESDRLGRPEVFLQPYNSRLGRVDGLPVQVSEAGGHDPTWSKDGSQIYFLDPAQNLLAVARKAAGPAGHPHILIRGFSPALTDVWTRAYSVAPDGRFIRMRNVDAISDACQIQVVVNWFRELRQTLPVP